MYQKTKKKKNDQIKTNNKTTANINSTFRFLVVFLTTSYFFLSFSPSFFLSFLPPFVVIHVVGFFSMRLYNKAAGFKRDRKKKKSKQKLIKKPVVTKTTTRKKIIQVVHIKKQ